jgi:hypothetical protein
MKTVVRILLWPRKTLEELKNNPRWFAPFVVLAAVSIVCYGLTHPALVQSTVMHLPHSATPADKVIVDESLRQELPLNLAFLPIRLFMGWSAFSLVLFHLSKAPGGHQPVRFSQILSLEVHSEVASALAGIATTAFTLFRAPGDGPARIPLSILSVTAWSQDFIASTFLSSINIFSVWQIGILSTGVSVICGYRFVRASGIALLAWGFSLLFNLAVLQMVKDELHLLL